MNKVILMGRLTREPVISYVQQKDKSLAVARFTLAVDRRMSKASASQSQQTADFISCVAFDKLGEFADKYLHQGTKIVLEGRIQTGSYLNKEGKRIYTTDVIAETVEFAESKSSQGQAQTGNNTRQETDSDGFMHVPDGYEESGLPFD